MSQYRPLTNAHAHRNSFSAATYTNHYPQNAYRAPAPSRSSNYESTWPVYALDWSRWPTPGPSRSQGKLAIGSFSDDMGNRIQVLQHGDEGDIRKVAEVETTLPYPVTKILWEPPNAGKLEPSMLATCGDYLRVFRVGQHDGVSMGKITQEVLLGNTKADFPAPLTSFDWNRVDPSIIVTASVDTTCTVWDLNTAQARTQLIAHDKEVFDVTFTAGSTEVFASVGADGSVRLFDLRALEHSTIIYESLSPVNAHSRSTSAQSPDASNASASPGDGTPTPLLRLSACERDSNLLATFAAESNIIQILDIRQPGSALLELDAHAASINAIKWAPHSRNLIASCADDCQVLVWDCNNAENTSGTARAREPVMAWTADSEVNNLAWNTEGDKLCAAYGRSVQGLKL